MATIIAQSGKPSEIIAAIGALKEAIGKHTERKYVAEDNRDNLEQLLLHYKHLKNMMQNLLQSVSSFDNAVQDFIRLHSDLVTRNEEKLQSWNEEVQNATPRNRVRRMKEILDQNEKYLEKVMSFLSERIVPVLIDRQKDTPDCKYVFNDNVPRNPPRLTLDYSTTATCEGQLKAAVMQHDGERIVGVVALGMGGVGKTCALRGLAGEGDVKLRFPGGLLYVQLGNDATLATLISGIATLVQLTGNGSLADKLKGHDSLQQAANMASPWFSGQTCLLLVDDVWLVHGINASVLSILATMLGEDSRLVYTMWSGIALTALRYTAIYMEATHSCIYSSYLHVKFNSNILLVDPTHM